ncbi:S1C family serine protease [Micromonospora sp. NPDC050417]|uniref:S1C family serine protease n=1 Tax=Micromonospora sp. NPDC050417 TaxID=3364280 RepID=UPI0037BA2934
MAQQSGLGEPRGPWFISPNLDPAYGGPGNGSGDGSRTGRRWRRILLTGLAVIALSIASGGLAGGYVAGQGEVSPQASASPSALPPDMVGAAAQVVPGVVSVTVASGGGMATGSGFAIDDQQHLITNDHIVAQASAAAASAVPGSPAGTGTSGGGEPSVMVETPDGRQMPAKVVGRDAGSDIAVLKVAPAASLAPLVLAKPGATKVGEPVLAVGSPLGLHGTVTAGIVSALDRQVKLGNNRHRAVQTDAPINPGNSGGPLVNARGEVVGVNTAIATIDGKGSIGIGFAIPIEQVQQVADTIIGKGG